MPSSRLSLAITFLSHQRIVPPIEQHFKSFTEMYWGFCIVLIMNIDVFLTFLNISQKVVEGHFMRSVIERACDKP